MSDALAWLQARWRDYRLYRDSRKFLTRVERKLHRDIGLEPPRLGGRVRKSGE